MNAPSSESADVVPDPRLVTELLREQAPELAALPVRVSATSGSSNWVFRLGEAMVVRLPRSESYVPDLVNEVRWLPHVAPHVVSPVPEVIAAGEAGSTYPRPWAVLSWIPGELPGRLDAAQQLRFAETLGGFLRSLHAIEVSDAARDAGRSSYRCGEPVTDTIDAWADTSATALADLFDPAAVREAWRRLRLVPAASQPACWVHTDLSAENTLVHHDGRLAGVIDFGGLGVGDRSVDLLYAWSLLDAPARDLLRRTSGADEVTWHRARAWAFVGPGLLTIVNYRRSMPERTARLVAMVEAVAAEVGVSLGPTSRRTTRRRTVGEATTS